MEARNKIIQDLFIVQAFFLITFLFVSTSWAASPHWVDDNGAAAWGSCQSASPLSGANACSLSTANSNASAGDTVYFRAGNYSTSLSPSNSGTSGNEITWAAYNGETVNLNNSTAGILLNGDSYQIFDGFTMTSGQGRYISAYNTGNNNHIEVKNCTLGGSTQWAGIQTGNSSYWNIHNNTFEPCGNTVAEQHEVIGTEYGSGFYIHDNTFSDCGSHACVDLGMMDYSSIKNNIFKTTGVFPGIDGVDTMIMIIKGSNYNVIENNTFYESGSNIDDDHTSAYKIHESKGNIFRKNIIYNIDQWAGMAYVNSDGYGSSEYNMYYNNTVYNSGLNNANLRCSGAFTFRYYTESNGLFVRYNQVVNNIISNHHRYAFGHNSDNGSTSLYGNIYRGNHLYAITGDEVNRLGDSMSISSAESNSPSEYYDNSSDDSVDPKLTNPRSADFTLQSDSPYINAGLWLTTIKSATGSGTSFVVNNPYFFTDGRGIPEISGDLIQLEGDSSPVRVTNINYSTATITVNKFVSWTKGNGVSLQYYGSGPDIGAREYGTSSDNLSAPVGLQIKVN